MQLSLAGHSHAIRLILNPAERFMLWIVACIVLLDAGLLVFGAAEIAFAQYGFFAALALLLASIGQIYRLLGRSQSIASALTCTALMIGFSQSFVVFNYLLLPLHRPVVDPFLMQVDSLFGYHWPDVVAFAADNPWTNFTIKSAYMSTVPQITVLILVLGFTGRIVWLHTLMLSISITSIMVVMIWAIWPTAGPMAFLELPGDVVANANPFLGSDYGKELRTLIETGPVGVIDPSRVKGLISFPSYHTTLAFTCAFCAYGFRPVFPFFVVLNALVLPGTLMHGGHHLVDVFAGFAVFVVGLYLARQLVGRLDSSRIGSAA